MPSATRPRAAAAASTSASASRLVFDHVAVPANTAVRGHRRTIKAPRVNNSPASSSRASASKQQAHRNDDNDDDDDEDDDDDDEDGPPVEETNASGRDAFERVTASQRDELNRQREKRAKVARQKQEASLKKKQRQEELPPQKDSEPDEEPVDLPNSATDGALREVSEDDDDADLDESESGSDDGHQDDDVGQKTARAPPASTSSRLDPSVFAAAFRAQTTSATAVAPKPSPMLASALKRDSPSSAGPKMRGKAIAGGEVAATEKKRRALAKTRDGLAMRRLRDGRTTVRALASDPLESTSRRLAPPTSSSSTPASSADRGEEAEVRLAYVAPDPASQQPGARARAFRKRKLGLASASSAKSSSSSSASAAAAAAAAASAQRRRLGDEEDPLGLQDPAFMRGGELYGVGLAGGKADGRSLTGKPRRRAGMTASDKADAKGAARRNALGGPAKGGGGWRGEGGRIPAHRAFGSFARTAGGAPAFGFASAR